MAENKKQTKEAKYYDFPLNSRLREMVNKKNIAVFSEALGVTQDAVRQWQAGYTRPDVDRLGKIAMYFGVSTDYLLGASDIRHNEEARAINYASWGIPESVRRPYVEVQKELLQCVDAFTLDSSNPELQIHVINMLRRFIALYSEIPGRIDEEALYRYESKGKTGYVTPVGYDFIRRLNAIEYEDLPRMEALIESLCNTMAERIRREAEEGEDDA